MQTIRSILLAAAGLSGAVAAFAADIDIAVVSTTRVMEGLNAPRGLAVGPDGGLYVAEAGSAFDTTAAPFVVVRGVNNYYGETGAVSRLLGGVQTRVLSSLPTLRAGDEATGPSDIAFNADGDAFVTVGQGIDVALRTGVFTNLGNLVRVPAGTTTPTVFADLAAFEGANNPAGDDVHSNPFKLTAAPGGGWYVIDAGANGLLSVTGAGAVSTVASFAPLPVVPGPFPAAQAVPTSIAVAPDGTIYVGELGGFPFTPDASRIHVIAPGGSVADVLATGFTHIIDMGLSADGVLYVLEHDSNGLTNPGDAGALYAFDPVTGERRLLTADLVAPTGLTIGEDGTIYVSNQGNGDGLGEVLAFTVAAIPEPASVAALAGFGVLALAATRRRARSAHAALAR